MFRYNWFNSEHLGALESGYKSQENLTAVNIQNAKGKLQFLTAPLRIVKYCLPIFITIYTFKCNSKDFSLLNKNYKLHRIKGTKFAFVFVINTLRNARALKVALSYPIVLPLH